MAADSQVSNTLRVAKWHTLLVGLILAGAVVGVYAKVVGGPFVFDDLRYVTSRPFSHLPDLSWASISTLLSVQERQPHRWLSHLSFAGSVTV